MIRKYKKGDVKKILVQEAQAKERFQAIRGFEKVEALSLVGDNGDVLAVFGFEMISHDEARCYALVGKNAGRRLLSAVRFLKTFIPVEMKKRKCRRLTMTVRCEFLQAHRLAKMLSFRAAEVLPLFFMGNDYQIYERIEKW